MPPRRVSAPLSAVGTRSLFRLAAKACSEGARNHVALHGAHGLSCRDANRYERLFPGARARLGAGLAIRGGVPVIFPRSGARIARQA